MKGELESGSTLGRYELLVRIGRGGMASVWVARERLVHSGSQRLVAVKAMLPELAKSSDFRSMFLEEGGLVRAIEHQNVVRVFEVAEDSGILFMAMEWVEGDSLRTVMREAMRRRPIPPEMTVRMIADTAAGLHAAHELRGWDGELRGIVHCDVSPHNILVGIDGAARLVDFGVARAMAFGSLTGGVIRGKFGYMSPEQARGRQIDRRSDVFSLGIVLFELLTGERLFKGRDKQQTVELVANGNIPPPSQLNPQVPSGLDPIVLRALERDRRVRYQTADEFRQALERWLVEQRILVSQAGVAQLVQRVLSATIEERRDAIREALVTADGKLGAGLMSDLPVMEHGLSGDSEHESISVSVASLSSISGSSANAWRARPSAPPLSTPSHSHSSTGTARPQVFDPPPKKSRPSLLLALGTMAGAAAGAAAVLWALQHRPSGADESHGEPIGTARGAAAAASPQSSTSAAGGDGLSIDSLPLAVEEAAAKAKTDPPRPRDPKLKAKVPPVSGPAPATPAAPAAPSPVEPEQDEPEESEEQKPVPEESVDLKEETEKPKKAATAPAEAAPSGPLAPLNRGAAIAALGAASSSVASCKKSDGPHGGGRASVTFAPNGSVISVGLPGKFAGTAVGTCIQGLYRRAKLQAFSGGPVTLNSSFNVPE